MRRMDVKVVSEVGKAGSLSLAPPTEEGDVSPSSSSLEPEPTKGVAAIHRSREPRLDSKAVASLFLISLPHIYSLPPGSPFGLCHISRPFCKANKKTISLCFNKYFFRAFMFLSYL